MVEGGTVLYKKTFPFTMHFNNKNEQFYPNVGFSYISLGKIIFVTVMMGH